MTTNRKDKKINKFRSEDGDLRAEIQRTMHAIDSARNHFEQEVDPTLIDCYIYELNAAQLRYQFLLRRMKSYQEDKPYEYLVRESDILSYVSAGYDGGPKR